MEKELLKDRWYVISAATAGTLMLKTDGADIPVEYSAGQTTFYAATGKYECDDASIIISGPFNGAPASVLGGGSLSPEEKAAVTSLASGSINYDGSFNVHATSLLTYGAPIDTMGGNVYHRDGSATFAGSYNGHNYAAVIDFKHFEVRRDGALFVHFHESNGKPVLELNGSRVLSQPIGTLLDGQAIELQHNGFYVLETISGDFNLAALSIAEAGDGVTTARIAVVIASDAGDDSPQIWPVNWNWLEGGAPQLDGLKVHYVSVERFGDYINAHVSHSNPL